MGSWEEEGKRKCDESGGEIAASRKSHQAADWSRACRLMSGSEVGCCEGKKRNVELLSSARKAGACPRPPPPPPSAHGQQRTKPPVAAAGRGSKSRDHRQSLGTLARQKHPSQTFALTAVVTAARPVALPRPRPAMDAGQPRLQTHGRRPARSIASSSPLRLSRPPPDPGSAGGEARAKSTRAFGNRGALAGRGVRASVRAGADKGRLSASQLK